MPMPGNGWVHQMAWNPIAPPGQTTNNWHINQQWASSNSPNGTYADKTKLSSGNVNRINHIPPHVPTTTVPSRFDSGTGNWAAGSVKVDQQTPWDTTGNLPPHNLNTDSREWNAGLAGGNAANAMRWGQPTAVKLPLGAANVWPQPVNGIINNTSSTITGANNANEWSQNQSIPIQGPNVHHSRIPSQHPAHDITGTAHWSANAPPPILINNGGVLPPNPAALSGNWCQPSASVPPGPEITRLGYDPNPQTPGPWVASQSAEMNNDMMWHDPNPKQKKTQRDTGTSVWGDPNGQRGEIRRWKDVDHLTDYPAPPSGTDWTSLPLNIPTPIGINNTFNNVDVSNKTAIQQPTVSSVSMTVASMGWGDPTANVSSVAVDIGTSRWGASTVTTGNNNTTAGNNNAGSNVVPSAGWSLSRPSDLKVLASNTDVLSTDNILHRKTNFNQLQQNQNNLNYRAKGELNINNSNAKAILEQIQNAVNRGLIDVSVLSSNPHILLNLTKLLQRLFTKERNLSKLQQQINSCGNSAVLKNEEERLLCEIRNVKSEMTELQSNLNTNMSNPALNSADGQSRLQLWKKANLNNGLLNELDQNSSAQLQSLIAGTQNISLNSTNSTSNVDIDDKNNGNDWKSGTLDWSAPNTINTCNEFDSKNNIHEDLTNQQNSSLVDDGPPEFVPGKKWEWRDPNKVAEDPNATPGTCKPNPLLSSAALQRPLVGNTASGASLAVSINNENNLKNWGALNAFSNNQSLNEIWNKQQKVPIIGNLLLPGNRMMNRPTMPNIMGFNSTNNTNRQQMSDSSTNLNQYWILFQIVNVNEQTIQQICSQVGRLINFMIVGHKVACAKFADTNIKAIFQRIKVDFMIPPQHVKLASDEEFDKMMRSSRANNVSITSVWSAFLGPIVPNGSNTTEKSQSWSNDVMSMTPSLSHFGTAASTSDFVSGAPF